MKADHVAVDARPAEASNRPARPLLDMNEAARETNALDGAHTAIGEPELDAHGTALGVLEVRHRIPERQIELARGSSDEPVRRRFVALRLFRRGFLSRSGWLRCLGGRFLGRRRFSGRRFGSRCGGFRRGRLGRRARRRCETRKELARLVAREVSGEKRDDLHRLLGVRGKIERTRRRLTLLRTVTHGGSPPFHAYVKAFGSGNVFDPNGDLELGLDRGPDGLRLNRSQRELDRDGQRLGLGYRVRDLWGRIEWSRIGWSRIG